MTTSFRDKKKFATVHGKQMAYIEEGTGDPIVFLHGNPMSSYLWRNVMPHLAGKGRLIAPDLIGMGDSDKLDNSGPDSYTFVEHRKYLFALLEQLGVTDNVTLVIHDWGSGLGFHWAHTHPEAVKGIAFMEAIVETRDSWDQFPDRAREMFQALRSPAGEEMVLEKNLFVEALVPGSILRDLTEEEMNEYRRPFANAGEDRRPTLTWPRQIPIEGQPADVTEIVDAYVDWLGKTSIPKLFVNADPGVLITGAVRDRVRSWPNITEVTVPGLHFIQEDSPDEIGAAVRDWHANL
ncbi:MULTISPECIES: haloalkane dehalogenase [unclassified Sulfitobacter]|uniref:haloalkane dehalogenase n=1 Tax=unclassified Sulfitobacter TaxID=196795 RepID=UPI0004E39CF9|nr:MULTISPECIES: haloalkane dehalogenase [unclassified Sulfitobacter]PTA98204.1 haloalkane dehalogenase [Sulfitobacter sp. CB-A]ULO19672.1 haloalkane dehalogenase [Sulfitobacter sp. CB2047]